MPGIRRITPRRWSLRLAFVLAALGLAATPLSAHEKGALRLNTKQAAPGDTVIARGTKLAKQAAFRLEVRGALQTFTFGSVHTDATGSFEMRLPLPPDAKPGGYLVVAVASDGDVSAQESLALRPRSAAARGVPPTQPGAGNMPRMFPMNGMRETPGTEGMPGMDVRATAAPADIRVITSIGEWIVIVALIIFALVGGVLLLPSAPSRPVHAP